MQNLLIIAIKENISIIKNASHKTGPVLRVCAATGMIKEKYPVALKKFVLL
jgi:hypothetical protein